MLPNRQILVRLGWPPSRLQRGDIVRRWSPASSRISICALSIVVRLQLLLRLGVHAVTPRIMMLLSTSYGFTHVPVPSELWPRAVSLISRNPAPRLLLRLRVKTYSRMYIVQ